jgi:hypothetical protein
MNLHFYWVTAIVNTSCFLIDISHFLIASLHSSTIEGVALYVIGLRGVQLFHPINFGGLPHLPPEYRDRHKSHSYNSQCYSRHFWQLERESQEYILEIGQRQMEIG